MIKISNTEVFGWQAAIRGMRNPMNSWSKSDSEILGDKVLIGKADLHLMLNLASKGPVHAKYRRFIIVQMDVLAPFYWWKEFDTYKIGTVANSCSTMHKLHSQDLTVDDFSIDKDDVLDQLPVFENYVNYFNTIRRSYISAIRDPEMTKKDQDFIWRLMIQTLPSSYNQLRTISLNYEVLANIYYYRLHHKLKEWRDFCSWIKTLPYSEIIIGKEI